VIPCPIRSFFGLRCPGCGMTTATLALVRGRFREAFTANPLAVPIWLLIAWAVVSETRRD
jgi:hypothetical protein